MTAGSTEHRGETAARANWMRVMALSDAKALGEAYASLGELPAFQPLRAPETGMAMVRGRAGGTGVQFNLGEVSVTRCAVAFEQGVVGMAYIQGRALRHAEQAAVLDGLLQMSDWHARVQQQVIAPLARIHDDRVAERAAIAARTRVEFFTMARGED